jgi:hypothetical protein
LCGDFDTRHGLIFRHKPDLIDFYAGIPGQSSFQLFGQSASFGAAGWERPHKPRELCLGGVWSEVNAGNPRPCQELRETSLSGCRTQWHSIEQDLIARSPEQQPGVPAFVERNPQFFPGSLKLRRSSHVAKFVQARKLQQNVQGANE